MNQKMIFLADGASPSPGIPDVSGEYTPVGGPDQMPPSGMNGDSVSSANSMEGATGNMPVLNMNHQATNAADRTQSSNGEMPTPGMNNLSAGASTEYTPVGGATEMPQQGMNANSNGNNQDSNQSKAISLSGSWKLQISMD